MDDHVQGYYDRIYAALSKETDLSQIAQWMEKNTSHPLQPSKPWTFAGHEYQIEIVSSDAHELAAKKCSQVGASEIFCRLLLAMMDVMPALTALYVMPTAGMAGKFTKGRLDPIIAGSKRLRERCSKDVDSNSMKQFGNSFMHIMGSFGQTSAISTPAQALFRDEYDFCNQSVLTLFMSRLGHAAGGGIVRDFSTPTVPGFGIDVRYEAGSKARFAVFCRRCKEFVCPEFMQDVMIPGFDGTMFTFEKEDASRVDIDIDEAYCQCPQCYHPLRWNDFLDTKNRQWVHEKPDVALKSYHIQPWDVPSVNSIQKILFSVKDYERKADWVNMKVGQAYADADNSFVQKVIDDNTNGAPVIPPSGDNMDDCTQAYQGFIMAADVGKTTSWLGVAAPVEHGYELVYTERIRQTSENFLVKRWKFLGKYFGVVQGVIDAGPDFTSSTMIAGSAPGRYWKCYYVNSDGKKLGNLQTNDEESTISAFRTGCFDSTAKRVNSGFIKFRDLPDRDTLKEHLGNIKRVDQLDGNGEIVSSWQKTGDDHYAHMLNYLNMAYDLSTKAPAEVTPGVLPMTSKVRMQTGIEDGPEGWVRNQGKRPFGS